MTGPAGTASTSGAPGDVRPLLLVGVGAAAGALARWWLGQHDDGTGFGWTTLGINIVGCFVLACLPAVRAVRRSPRLSLLLGPGLLGGFTTVSAWADETRALAIDGEVGAAGLYVAATLAGCVGAAVAGRVLVSSVPDLRR